ncbi:histone H2B.11-like [Contarinia nasturtii]|uniref:histone H2B.11-like n=1 Tax=Contarinia nasturtii TaxID=265458 RepID=UPI0012D3BCEE|nr:histone H2B.11-like [Contarinia nasturtii]
MTAKRVDKKNARNLRPYILKVMRKDGRELRINKKALDIVNDLVLDVFDRLAREASNILRRNLKPVQKSAILTDNDLKCAVHLLIPGELGKYASEQGRKAIQDFNKSIIKH